MWPEKCGACLRALWHEWASSCSSVAVFQRLQGTNLVYLRSAELEIVAGAGMGEEPTKHSVIADAEARLLLRGKQRGMLWHATLKTAIYDEGKDAAMRGTGGK